MMKRKTNDPLDTPSELDELLGQPTLLAGVDKKNYRKLLKIV